MYTVIYFVVIHKVPLKKTQSNGVGQGRPQEPSLSINRTSVAGVTAAPLAMLALDNNAFDDPGYSAIHPTFSASMSVNETVARQRAQATASGIRTSMPVYTEVKKERKRESVEVRQGIGMEEGRDGGGIVETGVGQGVSNEGEGMSEQLGGADGEGQTDWPVYTAVNKPRKVPEKDEGTAKGGRTGEGNEDGDQNSSEDFSNLYTEVKKQPMPLSSAKATSATTHSTLTANEYVAEGNDSAFGGVLRRLAYKGQDGGYSSIDDPDADVPGQLSGGGVTSATRCRNTYDSIKFPDDDVEEVTATLEDRDGVGPDSVGGGGDGELGGSDQNIYEDPDNCSSIP